MPLLMSKEPEKPKRRYFYCPECRVRCSQRSYSGKTFTFKCGSCEESHTVEMTKEEKKYFKWWFKNEFFNSELHKTWHDFRKYFFKKTKNVVEIGDKKITCYDYSDWKWLGYELICKVRKYAERHPEIEIACCDDDYHMGSDLVLIPHRDPKGGPRSGYWGTTVIFICQGTRTPTQFFLYPGHEKSLLDGLKAVKKIS